MYDSLDKYKTAFIIDEAHTWTTDCKENLGNVVGGGGENSKFKGALYQRLKEFAPYTPFIFGLTATTNNQHDGEPLRVIGIGPLHHLQQLFPPARPTHLFNVIWGLLHFSF